MVNICCDYKIVLICHEFQQFLINRLWCILIAIHKNVSAPICPIFLQGLVRIKSARIHILKPVFLAKIRKIFFKPLSAVSEACRSRKPCACTDYNSVSRADFSFNFSILSEIFSVDFVVRILENIKYHLDFTVCQPFVFADCFNCDFCPFVVRKMEFACGYATKRNAV